MTLFVDKVLRVYVDNIVVFRKRFIQIILHHILYKYMSLANLQFILSFLSFRFSLIFSLVSLLVK